MTPIARNILIYRGTTFTFTVTLRNEPTQIGTITADPSNDEITTSVAHGLTAGEPVQFYSGVGGFLPASIEQGRVYWVISVVSSTKFKFSSEYNGASFDITAAGTPPNQVWTSRPIDLTGWTVWAWVKVTPGGTLVFDLAPVIAAPTNGQIDLSKTDEETIVLTPGAFFWDMVLEDAGGVRLGPLFQGTCEVVQLVTEPPE